MFYLLVFIFWFAVAMNHHTPLWNSLLFAAFWTIVGGLVLYVFWWILMALGVGTYGIFKLFKFLIYRGRD